MINLYKIKDIGKFFGGLTGKSKEDFDTGNAKFVSYMTVFSNPQLPGVINDTVLISENEKQNKITKGDILFTGSSETPDECGMSCVVTQEIDEDIYLNSFCFGLRLNNKEIANPAYLSHYFRSNYARKQIKKSANGVTRFNISKKKFSEVEIVIPPIKVQEEIVKILDSFTNLIDALNEELSLRQKQFEYYREKLLTFDDNCDYVSISPIRGKRVIKDDLNDNNKYPVYQNSIEALGYYDKVNRRSNMTFIICAGAAGEIGFSTSEFWAADDCFTINHDDLLDKFIYYCIYVKKHYLKSQVRKASVPRLSNTVLSKLRLPCPPLAIQQSIVEKLDAFESLISSLKEEIALRQKQYEYYREKLLTFN